MKEDGTRYKDGAFEWNFCAYLPNTRYFAQEIDLRKGTHPLTSEDYSPAEVKVIKDDKGNKIGVAYTREEEGEHCQVAPGVTE